MLDISSMFLQSSPVNAHVMNTRTVFPAKIRCIAQLPHLYVNLSTDLYRKSRGKIHSRIPVFVPVRIQKAPNGTQQLQMEHWNGEASWILKSNDVKSSEV